MTPSSASISRTKCPLPNPPIAGLQDMAPIVSKRWVRRSVFAPARADAAAASQPACPPPITTTSYVMRVALPDKPSTDNVSRETSLLPDAKIAKDDVEQFVEIDPTGDASDCPKSHASFFGREFWAHRAGCFFQSGRSL